MLIIIMKSYIIFSICLMSVYVLRHLIFSLSRFSGKQSSYFQDIVDSNLPVISVLIPMHNEERVARKILEMLVQTSYPHDKLEIIPINDHSSDGTAGILDEFAAKQKFIKPLHRSAGNRGKPAALNDAVDIAKGEIIVVFDADYLPPKGILRDVAVSFKDPEIGAVMGRVIPENAQRNLLTKLLALERSSGYQVDQQARQNMGLITQYGGTVGGFRKSVVVSLGGFSTDVLTEDTELTFRCMMNGWKVLYNNRIECYEEVPEDWEVRGKQVRRWSRGHNQVMFRYMIPFIRSKYLSIPAKIDGVLLLFIYMVPLVLLIGIADAVALFFLNQVQLFESVFLFLAISGFNLFGNFAPFYQIGVASILDGFTHRIKLLPFILFNFLFNLITSAKGTVDAIIDLITKRETFWVKTVRYR